MSGGWINGANGLIPSNGFPLGQQLETAKAGHLPTQLTRRGIDQKKCKLLSTRRTPRLWSASVPANPSHRRGQFSARRLGRPRVHIQPLLRTVIAAPVTNARRQSLRNITIAHTRRIGGQIEPQGRAGHNDRQKVAFSYADGSRRQRLRGNITISSPRTAAGPRCDRRILVSSSGTHSVRSDRVAPDSLRIFRGLYFTIPRRELATRFTEILLYLR